MSNNVYYLIFILVVEMVDYQNDYGVMIVENIESQEGIDNIVLEGE